MLSLLLSAVIAWRLDGETSARGQRACKTPVVGMLPLVFFLPASPPLQLGEIRVPSRLVLLRGQRN